MRTSIQVGRIIGIPIRLHFTFLFIFFGIIYGFATLPATEYRIPLGLGGIEMDTFFRYFLSSIAAILFFFTLLLHELSHSYVAMKFGTKIHGITLFFFGGVAMMEDIPKSPEKEWRIAIAGPLMSIALGGLFLLAYSGIRILNLTVYRPVEILVFTLGFLNVALAFFNLIPAFPMDGGRVFRAFLAKRMPFLKATKRAVLIGKIFAVVMAIGGFIVDPFTFFLTGEIVTGNIWFPLLATFLYIAATEEENATTTFASLEGIKVKHVMRTENASAREDMSIMELANKMLDDKSVEYAVVDEGGELKGFITFEDIKKLSAEQRHRLKVSEVISSFDRMSEVISQEEEAAEALKRLVSTKKKVLAVEGEERGNIVGIITKRDLAMFIEMLKGRG
ncbi:MAG: site-2 protease family protein [Euryarchaeota archaeon]|nr:site-2 protease family protein [Euryarchaeota archaeon]